MLVIGTKESLKIVLSLTEEFKFCIHGDVSLETLAQTYLKQLN